MVGHATPLLWTDIARNSTNIKDCRLIIKRTVHEAAKLQAVEIRMFYLTDEMLKDIIKLDLAPGGGLPVFGNLQTGMSMLNT